MPLSPLQRVFAAREAGKEAAAEAAEREALQRGKRMTAAFLEYLHNEPPCIEIIRDDVSAAIAGRQETNHERDTRVVARKVGLPAWAVYQHLRKRRSHDGITLDTRASMAHVLRMSESRVKRALRTLREFALVGTLPPVPAPTDQRYNRKLYPRSVVGCTTEVWQVRPYRLGEPKRSTMTAPNAVLAALMHAPASRCGGKRPGAGRPRKPRPLPAFRFSATPTPEELAAYDPPIPPPLEVLPWMLPAAPEQPREPVRLTLVPEEAPEPAIDGVHEAPKEAPGGSRNEAPVERCKEFKPYPPLKIYIVDSSLDSPSGNPEESSRARARGFLTGPEGTPMEDRSVPGIGIIFGGFGRVSSYPVALVPLFPGLDLAASVPDPPLLDPSLGNRERALVLVRAYRTVAHERGARRLTAIGPRDVLEAKRLPALLACAELLIAQRRSPVSWVVASFRVWRHMVSGARGKLPPPLKWVFDANRLAKHEDDPDDEGECTGGRLIIGPQLRELMNRHQAMRLELHSSGATTECEVRAVVERHFPNGLYAQLEAAARAEAAAKQQCMQADLANGSWLWG